jgi:hypothetical protein
MTFDNMQIQQEETLELMEMLGKEINLEFKSCSLMELKQLISVQ